jgi:DNA-binding NarL/FixJ family response regulator
MITISFHQPCNNPLCNLTPRQTELLETLWVNPGMTNRELAKKMGISESTVKKHLRDIYRATGAKNRIECLALLLRGCAPHGQEPD